MKGLAITHKGIEDITSLEITELLKTNTIIKDSCVIFEPKSEDELALVCYKAQSIKKVLVLIDSFTITSLQDLEKSVKKKTVEITKFLKGTFAVRSLKIDNEQFSSEELILEAANALRTTAKVNLNNPDVIIFVYVYKDNCYLGIDISREDLSKRDYRIYTHQGALKATIAYALLRIANYQNGESILDPFCGSGTILIEAALYANGLSPHFYNKDKFSMDIDLEKFDKTKKFTGKIFGFDNELRHVMAAKKNAKIAGIEKSIHFSRAHIDDVKVSEQSIDKIITNPPNLTKRTNPKALKEIYEDMFHQAEIVLKAKGTITIITKTVDMIKDVAKHFIIQKERPLEIGKERYTIIVFNGK